MTNGYEIHDLFTMIIERKGDDADLIDESLRVLATQAEKAYQRLANPVTSRQEKFAAVKEYHHKKKLVL